MLASFCEDAVYMGPVDLTEGISCLILGLLKHVKGVSVTLALGLVGS